MAWGTPTSLGTATAVSVHSATLTGVTVGAGTLIFVCCAATCNGTADTLVFSDSAGNTWSQEFARRSTALQRVIAVGYTIVSNALSAGSITVSDTANGATNFTSQGAVFAAYSITGGASSSIEDTSVFVSTGGNSLASLTSGTPTQSGDLFVAATYMIATSAYTEDAAWTNLNNNISSGGTSPTRLSDAYLVNAGSTTKTWTPTSSSQTTVEQMIIGFKVAGAAPSGSLFRTADINGLGGGGPFFHDPLSRSMLGLVPTLKGLLIPDRKLVTA